MPSPFGTAYQRESSGVLRLMQIRLAAPGFWKNHGNSSRRIAASADRRFEFQKRRPLLISAHNETLCAIAPTARTSGRRSKFDAFVHEIGDTIETGKLLVVAGKINE